MSVSRAIIEEYYSNVSLKSHGEMATHTCSCGPECMPAYIRSILEEIPNGITSRFYGCGSPLPPALNGCVVLDLGCGTGRDVYLASKLVGPMGKVIGIDMNENQLAIAEQYHDVIAAKWGYDNVEFKRGFIEALNEAGIEDNSIDVVISNCVINLSPDKEAVFSEIWRVLKTGGELYFSDIFADRRVPAEINNDPVIAGECLGGAIYIEDYRRLMRKCGWEDFRYMSSSAVKIDNEYIEALIGNIQYTSRTIRAFKLPDTVEDICEQYGQTAIYRGGIEGSENFFDLDDHHRFFKDLRLDVCGNSCSYVQDTRYGKYFEIYGDRSIHFGPFEGCGNAPSVRGSDNCGYNSGCC